MESAGDKIQYNPYYGNLIFWDFNQYRPDVVLVAIGQNDNHPYDYMKESYQGDQAKKWRNHYREFLLNLREKYPTAHIVCHTTLLCHDASWDQAIGEVVESLNDKKISHYLLKKWQWNTRTFTYSRSTGDGRRTRSLYSEINQLELE